MEPQRKNGGRADPHTTVTVAIAAGLAVLMAALLLFVPQITAVDICYFICTAVIVLGIYRIVRYFMSDAFQNLSEYGFSEGVLFVVLGICGLVRAADVAGIFPTFLGILLLFSGVIKLQYALDLQRIGDKLWPELLGVTLLLIGCSVVVLLDPFAEKELYKAFTFWVFGIDGLISLGNILYLSLRLRHYRKISDKTEESKTADLTASGPAAAGENGFVLTETPVNENNFSAGTADENDFVVGGTTETGDAPTPVSFAPVLTPAETRPDPDFSAKMPAAAPAEETAEVAPAENGALAGEAPAEDGSAAPLQDPAAFDAASLTMPAAEPAEAAAPQPKKGFFKAFHTKKQR